MKNLAACLALTTFLCISLQPATDAEPTASAEPVTSAEPSTDAEPATGAQAKKPVWHGTLRQAPSARKSSTKASARAMMRTPEAGKFLRTVQSSISAAWHPVEGSKPVEVAFSINADGQRSNVRVHKSSGIAGCDAAAIKAVESAAAFPKLPEGFSEEFYFEFAQNARDDNGHGLTYLRGGLKD